MTTIPTPASQPQASRQRVFDALGHLHDEADRWTLAEALLAAAPQHASNQWFQQLVDDAEGAGIPSLRVNTMRQYRDTAARWPKEKRVEHASFTAHREAQGVSNIDDARKVLEDLITAHGAKAVTAARVRAAVSAHLGKPAPAKKPVVGVNLTDLMAGGSKLIDVIKGAGLDSSSLDKLYVGLNATLIVVQDLQVKAARKAGAVAKAKGGKVAPVQSTKLKEYEAKAAEAKPVAPAADGEKVREVGDLRGL
jgi:hypothetical protein